MPNWCQNKMVINGKTKDLVDFRHKFLTEKEGGQFELDFQKIMPEPKTKEDLKKLNKKYLTNDSHTYFGVSPKSEDEMYVQQHYDWYEWRVDHWGTKWEPEMLSVDFSKDNITIYYETAWGPPQGIINQLLLKNPNLTINNFYYESGMGYAGCMGSDDYEVKEEGDYSQIRWAINHGLESQELLDELIEENSQERER